jgi:hypothetical protein
MDRRKYSTRRVLTLDEEQKRDKSIVLGGHVNVLYQPYKASQDIFG